jgi:glycine cleavage system transcriptional repressor
MRRYVLTATGPDRPGLVARVSEILYKTGCNLEDASMTRLKGTFAILLIFSGPASLSLPGLQRRLKSLTGKRGMTFGLKVLSPRETRSPGPHRPRCLVSAHGPDRSGLVYGVTAILAAKKFNITDLTAQRTEGNPPGYILYAEGELPPGMSPEFLRAALLAEPRGAGLTLDVKPLETPAL